MRTKIFEHTPLELGYSDLISETLSSGRKYITPDGARLPSITTVLSILSEESIQAWRKRVGDEEANRISSRASKRGTAVHSIVEKYINNEEDFDKGFGLDIVQSFKNLQPILDNRIGRVYGQELALYSKFLGVAGRCDCIAEFDGVLSIIDFKTSKRLKKKDDITSYFIQEAAYSIMYEERTGKPITNLVTIMDVDYEQPLVFKEHRDNWTSDLMSTIQEYKRRQFFGA
jgi:genome maintenance exonuclease 1